MAADMNFVVYMYVREDGTPYYIGKGRPRRPYEKRGRACGIPPKERIVIVHKDIDEETAFRLEKELISKYGRKDLGTGILHNRSDGGEGTSGRITSEETRRKTSGSNNWKYTPRDWHHPTHGDVLQKSISELVRMFPDQKLCSKSLSRVAVKKIQKSMGWCLLKDKGVKYRSKRSIPRDWYHPKYGKILQKSCAELVREFPEDNIIQSCIVRVATEKIFHHKEWRLLKNKNVKHKYRSNVIRNWYHQKHGEVLQKTASELIKMFPDLELRLPGLSSAAFGKTRSYKGWTLAPVKTLKAE
jgi:hypothetical protein